MESISVLQVVTYVSLIVFVILFVTKVAKYAKMPIHLRWELYPLAGEKDRPWGGSYLEDSEWWNKPREKKSFLGEMKFMAQEILLFKEYFHRSRGFWYIVYPFHIGFFLFIGFVILLLVGAITIVGGIEVSSASASIWGKFVYYLTLITGIAGLIMGTLGSIGLLVKRLTDINLKPYTKRIDYLNVLIVLAALLTGLLSWALVDPSFAIARGYVGSLITFSSTSNLGPVITTHIVLVLLLLIYMPFTNMMHYAAKFFTHHNVRWDDSPNLRGSNVERSLAPLFNQPISWSAPHIKEEGIQCWGDIAKVIIDQDSSQNRKGVSK